MSFRCFTGRYGERAARAGLFGVLVVLAAWSAAVSAQDLLWFEGGRPRVAAWQAVDILQNAADDGLEPEDYDAAGLRNVLTALEGGTRLPDADLVALDAALSAALQRYLADLRFGRVDPRTVHENFTLPAANGFDPAGVLRAALAAGRLPDALAGNARTARVLTLAVVALYAAAFFVWLNYAVNVDYWLPYRFFPFEDGVCLEC